MSIPSYITGTNRTAAAQAIAAYKAGDKMAIFRFVHDVLGYRGGDAMRFCRTVKKEWI